MVNPLRGSIPAARVGYGNGEAGNLHDGLQHHSDPAGLTAMHHFYANMVKHLADGLSSIPLGEGTLFDRSVIVWYNTGGRNHHLARADHTALVIDGSRQLRGGHVQTYATDRTVSHNDFFLTVLELFGIDPTGWGDPQHNHGPLEALF